jgi:ribonuclease P protein component
MPSVATSALSVMSRPELWRISDRSTFAALRRRGRRAQVGPITVTWLRPQPQDPATPPRVGFAVGRSVGGAVVRNRIRRRLRAGLRELQRAGALPDGAYLLGASAAVAEMPWPDLQAALAEAVTAAAATDAS